LTPSRLLIASSLALAAAGAHAQSSLTIYGTVDTRLARGTGSIASITRLASSGTNSSRLGFRGAEDLGSGLSASFVLEADINSDDGTSTASNVNNQAGAAAPAGTQGLTFNRRSTVSLAGRWGELRLGRDYTPTFWNGAWADPYGNVGVGVTLMTSGQKVGPTYARSSNSIGYLTPDTLGGFYGQYMHMLGENLSNAANAHDGTGDSIRIGWQNARWNVAYAAGRIDYAAGDVFTQNFLVLAQTGFATLTAGYEKTRVDGPAPDARTWILGAVVPFGPVQAKLSYSSAETDAAGHPRSRKLALGGVYSLSKRTALYATVATLHNSGGASLALNNAVTAANHGSSGWDVGLRHSF
jgi:predicted porin